MDSDHAPTGAGRVRHGFEAAASSRSPGGGDLPAQDVDQSSLRPAWVAKKRMNQLPRRSIRGRSSRQSLNRRAAVDVARRSRSTVLQKEFDHCLVQARRSLAQCSATVKASRIIDGVGCTASEEQLGDLIVATLHGRTQRGVPFLTDNAGIGPGCEQDTRCLYTSAEYGDEQWGGSTLSRAVALIDESTSTQKQDHSVNGASGARRHVPSTVSAFTSPRRMATDSPSRS